MRVYSTADRVSTERQQSAQIFWAWQRVSHFVELCKFTLKMWNVFQLCRFPRAPRELRSPKLIGDACLERPIHWAHKHMPLLHSVYYSVTSFFEWSPYDVICILEPNLGSVRRLLVPPFLWRITTGTVETWVQLYKCDTAGVSQLLRSRFSTNLTHTHTRRTIVVVDNSFR